MSLFPDLNSFNFPVLGAALLNVVLIFFTLLKSPWNSTHRAFAAWNLAMLCWNLGSFGTYGAHSPETALPWIRFSCYGIVLIPATFCHVVLSVGGAVRVFQRRLLQFLYVSGLSFLAGEILWPGFLVAGAVRHFWGYGPIGGVGTAIMDPWALASWLYCLWLLQRASQAAFGVQRNQLQYIFWGGIVAFAGAAANILMVHGLNIYPFGNIANIVFSLGMAYAIISYRWMDIQLVIRQSVVYTSLGTALTLTYIGMVYFIEKTVFDNHLNPEWVPRLLALPPTLIVAPAVKGRIQPWVDAHLFSSRQASKHWIQDLGLKICTCLDLEKITEVAVQEATRTLQLSGAALLMMETERSQFLRLLAVGSLEVPERTPTTELCLEWFSGPYERLIVTRELEWRLRMDPAMAHLYGGLRDWLVRHGVVMALPLRFQKEWRGLWLLGTPMSEGLLPRDQLPLLVGVASQMALAINNALTVRQLQEHQQMLAKGREAMAVGTLATELAHELTKPLTRILNEETRLEGMLRGQPQARLKKIEKEAQRAAEILEGFAMLSPHLGLARQNIRLPDLVEEVLISVGVVQEDRLRVVRQFADLPPVAVNRSQMLQVFTNIIQNALEAMPEGGVLSLQIARQEDRGMPAVEVSVSDSGSGIPREIQEKVFEAFFTTKKAQGGRGVGLAISRAMVERHGGTIRIESPVTAKGGARVVIALPVVTGEGKHV
jgi:signal transduction histidine kinase